MRLMIVTFIIVLLLIVDWAWYRGRYTHAVGQFAAITLDKAARLVK
jgi:hypothetical protein